MVVVGQCQYVLVVWWFGGCVDTPQEAYISRPKNPLCSVTSHSLFIQSFLVQPTMKFSLILSTLLATVSVMADDGSYTPQSCSADSHCPEEYPCCSNEGSCGTGSYCLGPCDPRYSFNSTSCMPAPICKAGTYTPRSGNMMSTSDYLGNTTDTDFIYYGTVKDTDDSVAILMPKNSVGGVISSTFYVWYGKVSFKFKTSHNQGVVSAGILFSQVQDEIDYEFVGNELTIAESNYYFEGIADYTHSSNLVTTDTYANWHTYTIDWQEDSITWEIDGKELRTLKKSDTYNSTSGVYEFPQTPSRLQLSIWPAGDTTKNAVGTVEWAGGAIDWDATDFTDPGYLSVNIDTVEVECYTPPDGTDVTSGDQVSYIYDGAGFLASNIQISSKKTWMKNLAGTGFNPGNEEDSSSSSSSSSAQSSAQPLSSSSAQPSSSSSAEASSSSSSSAPSSTFESSTPSSSIASTQSSSTSVSVHIDPTTSEPTSTSSSTRTSSTSSTRTSSSPSQSGFVQYISSTLQNSNNGLINSPNSLTSIIISIVSIVLF